MVCKQIINSSGSSTAYRVSASTQRPVKGVYCFTKCFIHGRATTIKAQCSVIKRPDIHGKLKKPHNDCKLSVCSLSADKTSNDLVGIVYRPLCGGCRLSGEFPVVGKHLWKNTHPEHTSWGKDFTQD